MKSIVFNFGKIALFTCAIMILSPGYLLADNPRSGLAPGGELTFTINPEYTCPEAGSYLESLATYNPGRDDVANMGIMLPQSGIHEPGFSKNILFSPNPTNPGSFIMDTMYGQVGGLVSENKGFLLAGQEYGANLDDLPQGTYMLKYILVLPLSLKNLLSSKFYLN